MSAMTKPFLTGTLLGLCMLCGCDSSANPSASNPPGDPAIGTWKGLVSDSTMTMEVKQDMTFKSVLPVSYGTYLMSGTYTRQGNTLALTYTSGLEVTHEDGFTDTIGVPPASPDPVTATLAGTSMTLPVPYDFDGAMVTLKKQ